MPEPGDVVVSSPTATVEYDVSVVPDHPHLSTNHDTAVANGRALAERLGVDLWLTQDHTHFMRLASFREEDRTQNR